MRLHRFYAAEKVLKENFASGEVFELKGGELAHQLLHVQIHTGTN